MTDGVFSFVFDLRGALGVFPGVSVEGLLMAVLARVSPAPQWEDCVVYTGMTPLDPEATACVATWGPGAQEAQLRLAQEFETLKIPVLAVYESGPEEREQVARAVQGRWHVI
jgi:hypothetical protein